MVYSMGAIYELRRYRLKPGARETLIELFEREFIEPQEAEGMTLHGVYRDKEDPDAFVWIRSFPDMESRALSLQRFYSSEIWRRFGPLANSTMVNSDNVLLLKPAPNSAPFQQRHATSPDMPARRDGNGIVVLTVCSLAPLSELDFAHQFEAKAKPFLEKAGARIDAAFVTERSTNTFPRLPVREGETVFVWLASHADAAAYRRSTSALAAIPGWKSEVFPEIDAKLWRPMEISCLTPTARSRHGWSCVGARGAALS
jgi:quinol monooxygenase YgiN